VPANDGFIVIHFDGELHWANTDDIFILQFGGRDCLVIMELKRANHKNDGYQWLFGHYLS
jgi:hypothetical protein